MKFAEVKQKLKKHAPVILGVVGTIVASAAAVYYRQRVLEMEAVDAQTEGWPTIKIHPNSMEDVRNGAVLKYRQIRTDDGKNLFTQLTTGAEFSPEANKAFLSAKKEYDNNA